LFFNFFRIFCAQHQIRFLIVCNSFQPALYMVTEILEIIYLLFLSDPVPKDSVVICGLLHDLCKVNAYIKIDNGYKSVKGLKGHATVSISKITEHIQLTKPEDDIIRFHMGLFGIFTYREHDTLSMHRAIMRTPQVQIFAAIDMLDSKRK
jgi:hypothetical protein